MSEARGLTQTGKRKQRRSDASPVSFVFLGYDRRMLQTLCWTGSVLRLLDQTKLPVEETYVELDDEKQVWDAIKRLVVRGPRRSAWPPRLAFTSGWRGATDALPSQFLQRLKQVCDYLATSRPTAVNLFWAGPNPTRSARHVRRAALQPDLLRGPRCSGCDLERVPGDVRRGSPAADRSASVDSACCRGLNRQAATARSTSSPTATPGALATVAYGTALSPIYFGAQRGMKVHVWSDETRPLLQGSRITAFELQKAGVPVTVLCDNMAATLMASGKIDAVIVGSDRIAANGDVANKIGTLSVAILAKHFNVPLFVAAPTSTIDPACPAGSCIPIEQRCVRNHLRDGQAKAPSGVDVFNPAFDVTPSDLVTAIITERGVHQAPYRFESARYALRSRSGTNGSSVKTAEIGRKSTIENRQTVPMIRCPLARIH